ncbi:sodium channel modifier 1 isoform X2 [Hoplias malabaricus]
MKNGRYSCLVCSHRPVFDTVDMLTVHRKGKRHFEGLKWFYGKKAQLQNEIIKRQHQEYVNKQDDQQEAGSAPLLTQTRNITHHALLRSTPYSSCHKKASERSGNLTDESSPSASDHSVAHSHTATSNNKINMENIHTYANPNHVQSGEQVKKKDSKAARLCESEPLTEQRRRELEHYLKLKSAGWIQDPSGKWVKDENVEFDSDEEEPLPLLPSNETT